MSENKTWDRTETGTVFHNFGVAHAECRKNVKVRRHANLRTRETVKKATTLSIGLTMCKRCVQLDDEHQARIEASMEPVGEYDQACEGITGYGDAKAETSELVGTTWQSKDFDNTAAEITSVGTDLSGNVIVVNYDRLTQVTEGYQSREAGDMSLDMFKLYFRPLAEEQADDETGHEGTVCGVQLYDPFRGLGFCDKREYHHYREGHRGNFDEILSAHAEAIEEDSQRTASEAELIIVATEADAIALRAQRQHDRRVAKIDALHAEALMEDAARMGLTPGATFALKDRNHAYTTAEVVRVELGETGRKVVYTRRIRITADDSAQSRLQCGLKTFLSLYTPVANEPHVEPVRDGSDALNRLAQFLAN